MALDTRSHVLHEPHSARALQLVASRYVPRLSKRSDQAPARVVEGITSAFAGEADPQAVTLEAFLRVAARQAVDQCRQGETYDAERAERLRSVITHFVTSAWFEDLSRDGGWQQTLEEQFDDAVQQALTDQTTDGEA